MAGDLRWKVVGGACKCTIGRQQQCILVKHISRNGSRSPYLYRIGQGYRSHGCGPGIYNEGVCGTGKRAVVRVSLVIRNDAITTYRQQSGGKMGRPCPIELGNTDELDAIEERYPTRWRWAGSDDTDREGY